MKKEMEMEIEIEIEMAMKMRMEMEMKMRHKILDELSHSPNWSVFFTSAALLTRK